MNLKFIFVFYLFRINEVMSSSEEETVECVKRKSGTCKAFNVTEDFDRFFELISREYGTDTIFEFDYFENKHSYEREQNKNEEDFDTSDNPVIEILFKRDPESHLNYRLVLGEKLNRLAYLDLSGYDYTLYNNYSPDLPSWPFAINVTINQQVAVHTRDDDGLNNTKPFLEIPDILGVKYMSVRNRNRNVRIVGFYDCSTKYGANCGTVRTETISDCKGKFSPLGSGFFKTFVNIGDFNRSNKTGEFELDEVFGVYRRNNDSCVILFSPSFFEIGIYIRITIGDGIGVRVRTLKEGSEKYFRKDAVMKGWNQEPSHPNFIRIKISSVTNNISIYNIRSEIPILTMGLCNYFEDYQERGIYMSFTSDRFKTVDVYYDCCSPSVGYTCHIYEHNNNTDENSTPIRRSEKEIYHSDEDVENEVEFLDNSEKMVKTFLDTSDFRGPLSTQYVYDETLNEIEYCAPIRTQYFYDETLNEIESYGSATDASVETTTDAPNTGD